jgi:hypothetical protein
METQVRQIRQALDDGRKLTPLDAQRDFGCMRLAARIADLKAAGYPVERRMVDTYEGKRVAMYWKGKVHD